MQHLSEFSSWDMSQQHLNMRGQVEGLTLLGTERIFRYTPAIVLTLAIEVGKGEGERVLLASGEGRH